MPVWTSPKMTSNITPSPYIVSASSEYNSGYAAWKAMDGNSASLNYWNTAGPSDPANVAWWKIYTSNPICIGSFTIINLTTYGYKDFKLQGSHDDETWDDIYTGLCSDNNNVQTFDSFVNTNYYRYHRIFCVTCYSSQYLVIQEFSFSGNESILALPQNYIRGKRNRLDLSAVMAIKADRFNGICYPALFSDVYVKATSAYGVNYREWLAIDSSKSLIGSEVGNQWYSRDTVKTDQRFHVDVMEPRIVNQIYYENAHNSGASTNLGVKDFTFWGSNIVASFNDVTYANDTGWVQLLTSQTLFDQHVALNQADPKYISVTNLRAYRYYAFKFANSYGGSPAMGVRRIGLISNIRNCIDVRRNRLDISGVPGISSNRM